MREAAIVALGAIGGEQAVAVAREAWRADSSDEVRAAALVVLVRQRDPGARAAVLQGARDPVLSRRDSERRRRRGGAAARPWARRRRSRGQLGAQPLPALGLAALAARGDTAARARLGAGLGDERAWVREWSLEAVEDRLETAAALGLLREVQASSTRPEARREIAEAIGRLSRPPT